MAKYTGCRNCHNEDVGDNIYKCKECNVIYCQSCGDSSFNIFGNNNWICPICHSTSNSILLGKIESKNYNAGKSSSGSSSSNEGCFITTSCIRHLGLNDNCYELTVLRKFRDEYVLNIPNGKIDIHYYYKVSPIIINTINLRPDRNQIWINVYHKIYQSIRFIELNKPEDAYKLYKDTIVELLGLIKEEYQT